MYQVLGLEPTAKIDIDKLIVSGHQMGGATALCVADRDPRVQVVIANDPWMDVLEGHIGKFSSVYKKPVHIINTL